MRTSLHLGKIGGISIEVNFSWLIIFVLLTVSLATSWFPGAVKGMPAWLYWAVAVVSVLLFFGSVLAHELAHSLVARARGLPVKSITLFIFGGVSNIEREPQSAGVEFQMAFVGPLTSLLIGLVMGLAAFALAELRTVPTLLIAVFVYLGVTNLLLGVFNLIPGFPMDGGRVLRSIIWKATGSLERATRWAAYVGQAVAYLMIFGGLWLFFSGDPFDGLWIGFIGLFLLQAAQAEIVQVRLEAGTAGLSVGEVMTPPPEVAPASLSVQQVVDEYLLRSGQRTIPVVADQADQDGQHRLIGLVTLRDVRRLPREQWSSTPIGAVMTPVAQLKTAQPAQPLGDAVTAMMQAGVNQLPVIGGAGDGRGGGQLVGMLTLEAVVERLALRRDLGLDGSPMTRGAPIGGERPPSEIQWPKAG